MATMAKRDYYEVLGVERQATEQQIKSAYRKLALKYHPDRSTLPDAAAKMRELIEARDVLTDPKKRRQYDVSIGIKPKVERTAALRPEDV